MDRARIRGGGCLLLTAVIWGSSFVAQRAGMAHMGPFTFNGLRCFLGAAVLVPVLWFSRRGRVGGAWGCLRGGGLWRGGLACGVVLFCASSLQQVGIVETPAGKAGFLTALYILIVPLLGLCMGKRVGVVLWLCVGLGVAGLYLLCATEGLGSIGRGDWLLIGCAGCYAVHILVVDHHARRVDGIGLSAAQFLCCGVISLPVMFLVEAPSLRGLWACRWPFLYSGVVACGVGYTLQIFGQRETDPTVAAIFMCLESVFAVFAGWLVLGEGVTAREAAGCVVLFGAILLAQVGGGGGRGGGGLCKEGLG